MALPTIVLAEGRELDASGRILERELASELAEKQGWEMLIVPHLYDLPPDGEAVERLRGLAGDIIVLAWLYPRAAFWVLDANNVHGQMGCTALLAEEELEPAAAGPHQAAAARTIWCLDLRQHAAAAVYLREIERIAAELGISAVSPAGAEITPPGLRRIAEHAPPRWYPVVDRSRCGNCMECVNFCLFGVFGLDQGDHVFVEAPDNCRDGCPACSRVCPSGAILFPQHADGRIAGNGAIPTSGFKVDLSQLFRGAAASPEQQDRLRALAEREMAQNSTEPGENDELDRLVDDIDDWRHRGG